MGLRYPSDLDAWRKWQKNSSFELRAKILAKQLLNHGDNRSQETTGYLHTVGEKPQILIALDTTSPTSVASLLKPADYFTSSFAILAPCNLADYSVSHGLKGKKIDINSLDKLLPDIEVIVSAGHYLALGAITYQLAQKINADYCVVQHGLNTPFAPPLPSNSTLFAFSQADAEFWISERKDVTYEVVGSQLFYQAQNTPQVSPEDIEAIPIFLGQMHGAELPRASFAQAGYRFSKNHAAIYRPHPSEKDKLSLMTHTLWAKRGITIDRSATPLNQLNNPVVSVFSTGVLEAAMRGIPAWVYHPNPPTWLLEFWDRYGMRQWGDEPTPAPPVPAVEPALAIAQKIAEKLEK